MIPGRPWPDHGNRAQRADPQAAHLVAQHSGVAAQPKLAEPLFQEQPCLVPGGGITAFGFFGVNAEKDLPARIEPAEPRQGPLGQFALGGVGRQGP